MLLPANGLQSLVCQRPHYAIAFEQAGDVTFVHCRVDKWNAMISRSLRRDFYSLMSMRMNALFAYKEKPDAKFIRFADRMGFHVYQRIGDFVVFRRDV